MRRGVTAGSTSFNASSGGGDQGASPPPGHSFSKKASFATNPLTELPKPALRRQGSKAVLKVEERIEAEKQIAPGSPAYNAECCRSSSSSNSFSSRMPHGQATVERNLSEHSVLGLAMAGSSLDSDSYGRGGGGGGGGRERSMNESRGNNNDSSGESLEGLGARGRAEAADADASEFEGAMASMGARPKPYVADLQVGGLNQHAAKRTHRSPPTSIPSGGVSANVSASSSRMHPLAAPLERPYPGRTDAQSTTAIRDLTAMIESLAQEQARQAKILEAVAAAVASGDASTRAKPAGFFAGLMGAPAAAPDAAYNA